MHEGYPPHTIIPGPYFPGLPRSLSGKWNSPVSLCGIILGCHLLLTRHMESINKPCCFPMAEASRIWVLSLPPWLPSFQPLPYHSDDLSLLLNRVPLLPLPLCVPATPALICFPAGRQNHLFEIARERDPCYPAQFLCGLFVWISEPN